MPRMIRLTDGSLSSPGESCENRRASKNGGFSQNLHNNLFMNEAFLACWTCANERLSDDDLYGADTWRTPPPPSEQTLLIYEFEKTALTSNIPWLLDYIGHTLCALEREHIHAWRERKLSGTIRVAAYRKLNVVGCSIAID